MINPDQAKCYPPCLACEREGSCASWKPRPVTPHRTDHPGYHKGAPNHWATVDGKCGCKHLLPWPLLKTFGRAGIEVLCDDHGWTQIVKAPPKSAAPKKRRIVDVELPDEPMF